MTQESKLTIMEPELPAIGTRGWIVTTPDGHLLGEPQGVTVDEHAADVPGQPPYLLVSHKHGEGAVLVSSFYTDRDAAVAGLALRYLAHVDRLAAIVLHGKADGLLVVTEVYRMALAGFEDRQGGHG